MATVNAYQRGLLAGVVLLALASCDDREQAAPGEPEPTPIETPEDANLEEVAAGDAVAPEDYLITAAGVGPVSPGMTFAQMRGAMPEARFTFSLDGDAGDAPAGLLCAQRDGETHLCGRARTTEETADAQILWVETDNPRYRTVQGVAPGMSLALVAEVYGDVFIENLPEGEFDVPPGEYAEFDRGPPSNVLFVVAAPDGLAGDYAAGEAATASAFDDDAAVARILVADDGR